MSLLSRLLGKTPPGEDTPPAREAAVPVPSPPRPDPAIRAREEEASLAQALEAGDMAAVGRWVVEGSSTAVRQKAAQAIADPEQLRELIRATRHGRDKNVHRILTTKRDALLAEARRVQLQQAEIEATSEAIAGHAERAWDAMYVSTLGQLEARWNAVAGQATPELQGQVAAQLERARGVVEQQRLAAEAEAERRRAAALAAEEARRQREQEARAAAEAVEAAAAEAAAESERARQEAAERQAEIQAAQADEPVVEAASPAPDQARIEAEPGRPQAEHAEVRRLIGLLRQALAALEQGGTARAVRLRAAIDEKLADAPPLPPWFATRLQHIDERLAELKDWTTFTVVPKRHELVERMRSLIGADLSPEQLAQHIRRLRDEWRTLHRGVTDSPTEERQQFEDAARRAYEPCREHFAKQAEQRKENQAKRETLLARLAAFAATQSGEQPDWRLIQQVLAEARQEWREYAPVDQSVVKDLQARFHALLDELQGRLDAELARNVQAKRELIGRAAALLGLADSRQAIEESKALQRTWKTVGPVPRHQDNALWQEFRRHCDAVFERSAQEFAAHGATLETNVARATALCEELERIGGLAGEPLLTAAGQLDGLCAEFDALELPRASARGLRQRFERAADRCSDTLQRQRANAARRSWNGVLEAASQVHAYALAVAQGRSTEDCETLRATAVAATEALTQAPKAARVALDQRLAKLAAGEAGADLAANEAALRLLCVRAELSAGVATPPEDQTLRREHQMQRLIASMSRGERAGAADLDQLALEWIAAGPVEPAVYRALLARFERCRS